MSEIQNQGRNFVNIQEFLDAGKSNLMENAYLYYTSGSGGQYTMNANMEDFPKILLNPYVNAGLKDIDISTTVLGEKISTPVCVAPTIMHRVADPKGGELSTLRSSEKNKSIYTLSSLSSTPMKDIANESNSALKWYQLYIFKDRKFTESLIKQAEQLGFKAIVIVVDAPYFGIREVDERGKFKIPPNLQLDIIEQFSDQMKNQISEGKGILDVFSEAIDQSQNWEDIKWVQSLTKLPVILKGIQNGEDAKKAAALGTHIWVSNHGGRQLDTVRSTISVLPEVMNAIKEYGNKIEVYIDGGIRRGTDVVKCLALGAKCVFLGRPFLYALAAEGEQGVNKLYQLFEKEIKNAMMLLGAGTVKDLGHKHIVRSTIPPPNL